VDDENGRPSYRKAWRPPSLLHRVHFWLAGIEELGRTATVNSMLHQSKIIWHIRAIPVLWPM
jgi:hypothetical protein